MIRQQIWTNLVNTKFKCLFLGHLVGRDKRISIYINIFLAVISLSSISAWTIWKFMPGLLTSIIAVSNVLMAIKPVLPYEKRIKELGEKLVLLEDVQFGYEKLWFQYENGEVTDKEASKHFFDIYEKQKDCLRSSSELVIGKNPGIAAKSDKETDLYLKNHYGYEF